MRKLLLDTNVLMLLVIGRFDRALIPHHRRTNTFAPKDFDLLNTFLARYSAIVTTAPVLTELSNLLGNDFHATIAETLVQVCGSFREYGVTKEVIFADEAFDRLGFADASIVGAAVSDGDGATDTTVVLTDDAKLYNEVLYRGATRSISTTFARTARERGHW